MNDVAEDDVIDQVMMTFGMMRNLDRAELEEARRCVSDYVRKLSEAEHLDRERLAVYGLAYLKKRHDGAQPGFSGC